MDMSTADDTFFNRYGREQAIADGLLVDISCQAKDYGFQIPVAISAALWVDCVFWNDQDLVRQSDARQSQEQRLHDLLLRAVLSAADKETDTVPFDLERVPRDGRTARRHRTPLKLMVGAGDEGEPVMTLMLAGEDWPGWRL